MHFYVFMNKYVSMIALFRSPDHLEKTAYYLNSKHKKIRFYNETESIKVQIILLNDLLTTKPLLVGYILPLIVSFMTNITLVWFLLWYFEHFQ